MIESYHEFDKARVAIHATVDSRIPVAMAITELYAMYATMVVAAKFHRAEHFPARSAGQINRWKKVNSQGEV